MPNSATAGPLGKANGSHEPRLDPVMIAARRSATSERRSRSPELTKRRADLLEGPDVEPGADLGDVDELAGVVEPEMQRAEVSPCALRPRVAADHEHPPQLALDLQPVARALRGVGTIAPLRDHALQALLAHRRQKIHAVPQHVIAEIDDAARRHQELQALLTRLERQGP